MHTKRPDFTTWVDDATRAEFERRGYWTSETWLDLFLAGVEQQPSALCVADEQAALTRGQVLAAARRLAGYMEGRGIDAGDVVTVAVPNWVEFVVIHTAVGLLGAVLNPVLPRLGVPDYRHILQTSRSRMVFAAQSHYRESPVELCRKAAEGLASVLDVIAVRSSHTNHDAPSLEHILSVPGDEAAFPGIGDARDWDTVTFTSGTESLPKGVVHSHQSTMFGLRAYVGSILGLTASDCVFMPSPVCHASGLQWGLRAALHSRAPLILQDRWDPQVALRLIDEHQCTYTLAATPFIVDLIAAREVDRATGSSLRYVCSGGASIPRHLVGDVREAFGAQMMSVFGASETYIATCTRPADSDDQLATDGIALPGVDVAIVDESGAQLPTGVEGEITSRGPNAFLGYLGGDAALTQRAFRGSWYRFGDLGTMDHEGRIRVTGRIKDIVIRGGENISAREIEEFLADHPAVAAVAVIGYPDARLGERCCAVMVPAVGIAPPALDDLCSFLRQRGVAKFKLPERLQLVDALPVTPTGKVKKAELRALVALSRQATRQPNGHTSTRGDQHLHQGYGIQGSVRNAVTNSVRGGSRQEDLGER